MKLFIWIGDGVLQDYTSGQITAIAPDLETALDVIRDECLGSFPAKPSEVIDLGECSNEIEPRAWITWGGG